MGRKTKIVTIQEAGRDQGRVFHITEMDAYRTEKWAIRAGMALAKAGVDLGDLKNAGMLGIAYAGLRALSSVNFYEAEPLLDEMMACVEIVPDPKVPSFKRPIHGQDDIEEVATIWTLRQEVFELHTGFSAGAARSAPKADQPAAPQAPSTRPSKIVRTRPRA